MGLDVSHNAFSAPYSAFHRWRTHLALTAGLPPLSDMEGFGNPFGPLTSQIPWSSVNAPPALKELLSHSDCDGEIAVEHLEALATELERLAALMTETDRGDMKPRTRRFADGCRTAALAGEPLRFH
jgi:hypothetical protein